MAVYHDLQAGSSLQQQHQRRTLPEPGPMWKKRLACVALPSCAAKPVPPRCSRMTSAARIRVPS